MESVFLHSLHLEPSDETTWLALADWFEENDFSPRAELVRLTRQLRKIPLLPRAGERLQAETRLSELLIAGVAPVVPKKTNSLGIEFALIPPGVFLMGSPEDEPGRYGTDEEFLHEVEITQPFYLSIHPITQAQWVAVMGENPSSFQQGEDQPAIDFDTADLPVERISWELAHEFLKRLNADPREQQEGRRYRLPTEAEWEYAARGGPCSSGPFPFGDTLTLEHANFGASLREDFENDIPDLAVTTTLRPVGRPTKVGSYLPNAFGLYDMHGNVLNWCSDFFDADYYLNSPREDPQGPGEDEGLEQNCTRGGSWNFLANLCRSADRGRLDQGMQNHDVGIRPVLFFESRRVGT